MHLCTSFNQAYHSGLRTLSSSTVAGCVVCFCPSSTSLRRECGTLALHRLLGGNIGAGHINETPQNNSFPLYSHEQRHPEAPELANLIIAIINMSFCKRWYFGFEKCIQLQLVCHMSATADVALPAIKLHFLGQSRKLLSDSGMTLPLPAHP